MDAGCPSAGHLRMGRADWTIPQVFCACAVNVPVEGANKETFEWADQGERISGNGIAELSAAG